MKQIFGDLWQSEKGTHFGLDLRTYFLKRKEGNVLFYYTNNFSELEAIKELGGIQFQYLSHHHEMLPALAKNIETLHPILGFHKNAFPHFDIDYSKIVQFNADQIHSENIKIIDTPGHTNSNLCFYYQSPFGKNYLFTGDTIYLDNGNWAYLIFENQKGGKNELRQSLSKLRKLDVDVVICSVAEGKNDVVEVTQKEWHAIIDGLIQQTRP